MKKCATVISGETRTWRQLLAFSPMRWPRLGCPGSRAVCPWVTTGWRQWLSGCPRGSRGTWRRWWPGGCRERSGRQERPVRRRARGQVMTPGWLCVATWRPCRLLLGPALAGCWPAPLPAGSRPPRWPAAPPRWPPGRLRRCPRCRLGGGVPDATTRVGLRGSNAVLPGGARDGFTGCCRLLWRGLVSSRRGRASPVTLVLARGSWSASAARPAWPQLGSCPSLQLSYESIGLEGAE
jgi:hypothetical protein